MNKKAIGIGYVVIITIFIFIFTIALLIIFTTNQDPTEMIDNVGNFDDELEMNLDLTNKEILNIYEIEDFFSDSTNENRGLRLNIRNYETVYLKNLIYSGSFIRDEFNYEDISKFISYFNDEENSYDINMIRTKEFYDNLDETIFICNLYVNEPTIQRRKLNNLYENLVHNKIDKNFLLVLMKLLDNLNIDSDMYINSDDSNSFNNINNIFNSFDDVSILNPDYITKDNNNVKRFYLKKYEDLEDQDLYVSIKEELSKLDIDISDDNDIYLLASIFYIFPCLLFNYKQSEIYKYAAAEIYYIKDDISEDDNLNDIIMSIDEIEMNKKYSNFLGFDSLLFYKKGLDLEKYRNMPDEIIRSKFLE